MINRAAVIALCSQAWALPPDEIEQRINDRSLTLQQLVMQAKVQILTAPLTGQALNNLAFPSAAKIVRQTKHSNENNATYEALKRIRDRQAKGQAQAQAKR